MTISAGGLNMGDSPACSARVMPEESQNEPLGNLLCFSQIPRWLEPLMGDSPLGRGKTPRR